MCNQSALIGAIVFVWLPQEETPTQPGPKFRPVIVLEVEDGWARVAYGTSQKTQFQASGEFHVEKSVVPTLLKDTKFCLRKNFWIPLNGRFFTKKGKINSLGRIPGELADRFQRALEESGLI